MTHEEQKHRAITGLYEDIRALVRIGERDLDKLLEQVKIFWEEINELYPVRS